MTNGGNGGARTRDLRLKRAPLYLLSYIPEGIVSTRDSDLSRGETSLRPHPEISYNFPSAKNNIIFFRFV